MIVLPEQGFSLIPLQFQDPNRVKFSSGGFTCILMRVGQPRPLFQARLP